MVILILLLILTYNVGSVADIVTATAGTNRSYVINEIDASSGTAEASSGSQAAMILFRSVIAGFSGLVEEPRLGMSREVRVLRCTATALQLYSVLCCIIFYGILLCIVSLSSSLLKRLHACRLSINPYWSDVIVLNSLFKSLSLIPFNFISYHIISYHIIAYHFNDLLVTVGISGGDKGLVQGLSQPHRYSRRRDSGRCQRSNWGRPLEPSR